MIYPISPSLRTRWIKAQRRFASPKNPLDPQIPYAFLSEYEIGLSGEQIPTATIFLTNRECPYRCLMCDLWLNTLDATVPSGAIAAQIHHALHHLPMFQGRDPAGLRGAQIKLYNAGSFFDPRAIPPEDYPEIAEAVSGFGRVVVECHPALVGERALSFRDRIGGKLEVAIGLETAHEPTLDLLNKRFNLADFRRAAAFLAQNGIDLRVFLLLNPPFMNAADSLVWVKRSLDVAFDAGATVCCIIPTRAGNGAMERIAQLGEFTPPRIEAMEEAVEYGLQLGCGRVFADLWDIERFFTCKCSAERGARLAAMNEKQMIPAQIVCGYCSAKG
jgi:radical SAM enzyme (TIGR01210 family)